MRLIACALPLVLTTAALAQFGTPGSTRVREKITGKLLSADGAPTVAPGDQLGAFVGTTLCGMVPFNSTSNDFSITIFGDDLTTTTIVEGPKAGQAVSFRFYDASANQTRTDLRVENLTGEAFNYRYAGEESTVPDGIPIPIDLTPNRNLNIKVGATSGGNNGGGGGNPVNQYDVDADGKVTTADAAMVLRIVTGGARGVSDATKDRADVTGDNKVDTADAIEIMRNR